MYVPPHNRNEDAAQLLAFMRKHKVTRLQARWKLSQDRTPAERAAIIASLESSADAAAAATAALMRRAEAPA